MGSFPFNWAGKLVAGLVGLVKGGFWGAVLGVFIGHWFDQWLSGTRSTRQIQQVFSNSLFATLGYLAKADGRVSEAEIAVAEALFVRMALSADDKRSAIAQFNRGKQADFNLHRELQEFSRMSMLRPDLRRIFIEILLDALFADGRMTEPERRVLMLVAEELHITHRVLDRLIEAYGSGPAGSYQAGPEAHAEEAYRVLGVSRNASAAHIKRAYRKLMSQYHPDKLIAKGLPPEMLEVAKQKAKDVNTAYDRIKELKGFN